MLLVAEELTPKAKSLWRFWSEEAFEIVTAPLFFAEVTSVLREHVHFGRLLPDEGEAAFETFLQLGIEGMEASQLQPRAWALAKRYGRPRAYDAQYMAVVSVLGCDLWTADHRLDNAVNEPWLRWVGDYQPSPAR